MRWRDEEERTASLDSSCSVRRAISLCGSGSKFEGVSTSKRFEGVAFSLPFPDESNSYG